MLTIDQPVMTCNVPIIIYMTSSTTLKSCFVLVEQRLQFLSSFGNYVYFEAVYPPVSLSKLQYLFNHSSAC
jgi:hypothetical protein